MPSIAHFRSASATQPSTSRGRPRLCDGPRRSVRVVTPPADDSFPDPFEAIPISISAVQFILGGSTHKPLHSVQSLPDLRSPARRSGLALPASPSPSPSPPPTPPTPASPLKARNRKRDSLVLPALTRTNSGFRPVRTGKAPSPRALSIIQENEEYARSARQRMRDERRRRERAPVRGGSGQVCVRRV